METTEEVNVMKVYTHGVNGYDYIVVEGTLADMQQMRVYRRKMIDKAREEVYDDNPYRDGHGAVLKLADSYDRKLIGFIPDSNPDDVWMRPEADVVKTSDEAEAIVQRKRDSMPDLREIFSSNPMIPVKE